MTKLPSDIKAERAIKTLKRLGFERFKARGSHVRLVHPDGRWTQIACHPYPIPKGTLKKILREAEIPLEDFLKNL